jgi:hypothetical protein
MPLDEPPRPGGADPVLNALDRALHDGAVVLDAYARFTAAMIGALLFPYAAVRPAASAPEDGEPEPAPEPRRHGIIKVVAALVIGAILGRRLFGDAER